MSDEHSQPSNLGHAGPTVAECIEAGNYYYHQGDLAGARAWWQYALNLDPTERTARERLIALDRVAPAGAPPGVPPATPFTAIRGQPIPDSDVPISDETLSPPSAWSDDEPDSLDPQPQQGAWTWRPEISEAGSDPGLTPLPDDFYEKAGEVAPPSSASTPAGPPPGEFAQREVESSSALPTTAPPPGAPPSSAMMDPPASDFSSTLAQGGLPTDPPARIPNLPPPTFGPAPPPESPGPAPRTISEVPMDPLEFATSAPNLTSEPFGPPSVTPWDFGPARSDPVTLESLRGHDAVAGSTPPPVIVPADSQELPETLFATAQRRVELDDLEGALELIGQIPDDARCKPDANALSGLITSRLQQIFESKLGSLDVVPRILVSEDQMIWESMDHRIGYVLSKIDNSVTYRDLVSLSGVPRIDTLRILSGLAEQGVIGP